MRVVYDFAHVLNKAIDRLVVDFILLQLPDVKDANIVEPFATVKAAKYEELFGANHACGMSLSPSGGLFTLNRVTPSHGVSVENIQVIARNNFLERAAPSVVTSE